MIVSFIDFLNAIALFHFSGVVSSIIVPNVEAHFILHLDEYLHFHNNFIVERLVSHELLFGDRPAVWHICLIVCGGQASIWLGFFRIKLIIQGRLVFFVEKLVHTHADRIEQGLLVKHWQLRLLDRGLIVAFGGRISLLDDTRSEIASTLIRWRMLIGHAHAATIHIGRITECTVL